MTVLKAQIKAFAGVAFFVKKVPPLRRLYHRIRIAHGFGGQSDESAILKRLVAAAAAPKTFVEFGFHASQFNCAALLSDHRGLLVDANPQSVEDARLLLPKSVRIEQRFLTLDNTAFIAEAFDALGVLSIDVDGNDYWLLEKLLPIQPAIVCVEYNSSLGLRSLTVPYDPGFDRYRMHPSGFYHGASLTALAKLCAAHGYGLAAVADGGANAFFTRTGSLDPLREYRSCGFRDRYFGNTPDEQWQAIQHMPFVSV